MLRKTQNPDAEERAQRVLDQVRKHYASPERAERALDQAVNRCLGEECVVDYFIARRPSDGRFVPVAVFDGRGELMVLVIHAGHFLA